MENKKQYRIKKTLLVLAWLMVCVATVSLLVAAIHKNDAVKCKNVEIKIYGISAKQKFVDEKDVLTTLTTACGQNPVGKATGKFNLQKIETELEKNAWIKSAELFFDNNNILKVKIYEREPVARVFTANATSYYIDTALKMLPLSDKFSARLPVFTGFPTDNKVLAAADSSLLNDIKNISLAIQKDTFHMAMIEQINITPQRNFEMIPKIGNQLIVFGNADEVEDKFEKLNLFYKNVITKTGWGKYSEINLQYKNQVVAKIKGAEGNTADSLKTLQLMQLIALNASRMAEDSVQTIVPDNSNNTADSSMIQQSIQRDDNIQTANAIIDNSLQPTNNPPVVKQPLTDPLPSAKPKMSNPPAPKPVPVKPKPVTAKPPTTKQNLQQPKAVMPFKN
jgi:cell division protein FtsQ